MKNIINLFLIFGTFLIMSCIEEPGELDILTAYSEVGSEAELSIPTGTDLWIDPTVASTTFMVTGSKLEDIQSLVMQVVWVSSDEDGNTIVSSPVDLSNISDITALADTVSYELTGNELLAALGISVGDLEAGNRFQIIFTKTIGGVAFKDRASHSILMSCPSDIPEGTYGVKGSSSEVTITSDGAGVYTISNLNFNYYNPAYGDIPAKFLDVCNDLTLQGFNEGTAYGIAWIGPGTYVPGDKAELSFTYADQTYNAEAFATITFVQQ